MRLYLVRHGEAMTEADDPERSLTAEGARSVERLASWAAAEGVEVDEIRHSGKKRAAQTAEILADHLSPDRGVVAVAGLRPNDDVESVGDGLAVEHGALMLAGHLPFLARLASYLLTGDPEKAAIRFPTAGAACLEREGGTWSLSWVVSPDVFP